MTMRLAPLALSLGLAGLLAAAPPAAVRARQESGYDRALREATRRAQTKLERSTVLYTDHSRWEDPWVVTTRHYSVTTIDSYFVGRAIADGLESMLQSFQSVLGTEWAPDEPLPILLYPDLLSYNQFGDEFGDLRSSISGSYFATTHPQRAVAAMPGANITQTQMWITHAAAQQFIAAAFGTTPPTWISEGIGAYFSLYWAPAYGPAEMQRLIESRRFLPLSALIGASVEQYQVNAHDRFMELGTFFWYLLHVHEATRIAGPGEVAAPESFADYLRTVLSGDGGYDHPFYEYFRENAVEIERDLRAHDFGG